VNRFLVREHVSSILVAALGSTFGVALLLVTDDLATYLKHTDAVNHAAVQVVLRFIAFVFIAVALYTAAVITSNTFATIIAGRTRTIALLRLLGATARSQRRAVAREGLLVGLLGSAAGLAAGVGGTALAVWVSTAGGLLPRLPFTYFSPIELLPPVAVLLTTWLASWIGARRVLVVSPVQATGAAEERPASEVARRRGRNVWSAVLFIAGVAVLGAEVVMPPALRLVGLLFGRNAPAALAGRNALRYPERSARTTIGIVIGVTLVTMFSVAVQTFIVMVDDVRRSDPQSFQQTGQILTVVAVIFSAISGFSALLAAIGMVNNLSLSVLQRIRELGLLRALGFTGRQVRGMIVAESAQLTLTAVFVGLLLGTFYGWAGAEAMLGSARGGPGIIWPAFPPVLLAVIVTAAALLIWVASAAPARRATRVTPVDALAVD